MVAAQGEEAAMAARKSADAAHKQAHLIAARLAAAEELLGEREECLSELRADLADVKQVRLSGTGSVVLWRSEAPKWHVILSRAQG